MITVCDRDGNKVEELALAGPLQEFRPNKQAIHDYVVMYRYNCRKWAANTKTRAEIRGSGKKPWRQKGTGRARAGSHKSPIFRGGGVAFGPKPKNVYYNLPKKVRRLAFKSALVHRLKDEKVLVIDELKIDRPKTKEMAELLKKLKVEGKALLVLKDPDNNQVLSIRNIPSLALRRTDNVNAYDILASPTLILTKESYNSLIEMVGNEESA